MPMSAAVWLSFSSGSCTLIELFEPFAPFVILVSKLSFDEGAEPLPGENLSVAFKALFGTSKTTAPRRVMFGASCVMME